MSAQDTPVASRTAAAALAEPEPPIGPDPIAFLYAEHARQEALCAALDDLVAGMEIGPVADRARAILTFLTQELGQHVRDEEKDLFPMLAARSGGDRETKRILKQLTHEHALDGDLVDFLIDDLRRLADGRGLANPTRLLINLKEFTATQRRHLAWENQTVLPLAERVLSAEDKAALAAAFRARRDAAAAAQPASGS